MPLFTPDMLKKRITDITMADLRLLGVRGLLLDVDNTLTTHGSQELDPAVQRWLEDMAAQGVRLTVVSNGLPKRVEPFARRIGLRHISLQALSSRLLAWSAPAQPAAQGVCGGGGPDLYRYRRFPACRGAVDPASADPAGASADPSL